MGTHWRILTEGCERLNIRADNGQGTYKNRTLTYTCSDLPGTSPFSTTASPGSECVRLVGSQTSISRDDPGSQTITSVTIGPKWSLTHRFSTFGPSSQLRINQKKAKYALLTHHTGCPASSQPTYSSPVASGLPRGHT